MTRYSPNLTTMRLLLLAIGFALTAAPLAAQSAPTDTAGLGAVRAARDSSALPVIVQAEIAGRADGRKAAPSNGAWLFWGMLGGPITLAVAATSGGDAPEPPTPVLQQWGARGGVDAVRTYRSTYVEAYSRAQRSDAITGAVTGTILTSLLILAYLR